MIKNLYQKSFKNNIFCSYVNREFGKILMNILVVSQYLRPENFRINDLVLN